MNIEEKPNSNLPPSSLGATAPMPSGSFDSSQCHHLIECHCGIQFAIPMVFFIRKSDNAEKIFCPNGHAFTPEKSGELEKNTERVQLLAALIDERSRAGELQRKLTDALSRIPADPAEISDEELKRRFNLITTTAKTVEYGRKLCAFCGKSVQKKSMPAHLLNLHPAEVKAMNAEAFR